MFGATNIVKNSDKAKWVYNSYETASYGTALWNFGNDFARNIIISGVENSSSSHAYNCKNIFLVLAKDPTDDIDGDI